MRPLYPIDTVQNLMTASRVHRKLRRPFALFTTLERHLEPTKTKRHRKRSGSPEVEGRLVLQDRMCRALRNPVRAIVMFPVCLSRTSCRAALIPHLFFSFCFGREGVRSRLKVPWTLPLDVSEPKDEVSVSCSFELAKRTASISIIRFCPTEKAYRLVQRIRPLGATQRHVVGPDTRRVGWG